MKLQAKNYRNKNRYAPNLPGLYNGIHFVVKESTNFPSMKFFTLGTLISFLELKRDDLNPCMKERPTVLRLSWRIILPYLNFLMKGLSVTMQKSNMPTPNR